ncbi:MAG: sigma-70 family RNA polymerase sigma factor [Pyrinomonadaceae bacterium]
MNSRTEELIPHLFRTEYSKIAAVLGRAFGLAQLNAAEDIASETFLAALETWSFKGVPENPTAWLYAVAKNKARNYLKRTDLFNHRIAPEIDHVGPRSREPVLDLSDQNITDSQLQMLFAVCHPSISTESQIGLALRILCGFGIEEIADAFLISKETINKRLFRAKEKLRREKVEIELPGEAEIAPRLEVVLTTLYLLFNEGYYSESQAAVVRVELCTEAMRLTCLLLNNEQTNKPSVSALLALMCFHSSRFRARKTEGNESILYEDQDETLWDRTLIAQGAEYLHQASRGDEVSKYHLEAGIAYWHTIKEDSKEKWSNILQLHDHLLLIEYSPIAALNRAFALAKVHGNAAAIVEAEKLNLANNHYYFTLLGELYREADIAKAKLNFERALSLAKTPTDRNTIQAKLDRL